LCGNVSADVLGPEHADLAIGVQHRMEEVVVDLATRLHIRAGHRQLVMAGGTALSCGVDTAVARRSLFDRDSTPMHGIPSNGDQERVRTVDGAMEALARLRASGWRISRVTDQSGVARGLIRAEQVAAVHRLPAEFAGPFDVVRVCPHVECDGCGCRKPTPGRMRRVFQARLDSDRDVLLAGPVVRAVVRQAQASMLVSPPGGRPRHRWA
jgi:HAD superfamily hydrolase (TIGR01662 family)